MRPAPPEGKRAGRRSVVKLRQRTPADGALRRLAAAFVTRRVERATEAAAMLATCTLLDPATKKAAPSIDSLSRASYPERMHLLAFVPGSSKW